MEISNLHLGNNVNIDSTSSINNVIIGDNVKVSKYCSIYGSKEHVLEIGKDTYIGMFTILNGFAISMKIGEHVSVAQNVNIMTESGPNASLFMQKFYPIIKGEVIIEDHVWIGASVIVMPGVRIGRCSIVAANSFVNSNIEPYCLYAGSPARLIKKLGQIEKYESKEN